MLKGAVLTYIPGYQALSVSQLLNGRSLSRFLNRKHNMQSNAEYNMIINSDIVATVMH